MLKAAPSYTLNDVLSILGLFHYRATDSESTGKHHICEPDGTIVFTGRANEVWDWLRRGKAGTPMSRAVTKKALLALVEEMLDAGAAHCINTECCPGGWPDAMEQDTDLAKAVIIDLIKRTPAKSLKAAARRLDYLDPPGHFNFNHSPPDIPVDREPQS